MVSKTGHLGLADALFGKGRQRVLAAFFGDPSRRLYVRQVERLAGTGLGSVQRELARLTAAGLLVREREGRQTYYRANPACPVFGELRDLMRKTAGAADVVRAALAPLQDRIRAAAIFGSFADGTERAASDVDLLVIGDTSFGEVVDVLRIAEEGLARPINPVVYTVEQYLNRRDSSSHFVSSLDDRAKIFVIGDADVLAGLAGKQVDQGAQDESRGGRRARQHRPS